jgi:hypothetical protein
MSREMSFVRTRAARACLAVAAAVVPTGAVCAGATATAAPPASAAGRAPETHRWESRAKCAKAGRHHTRACRRKGGGRSGTAAQASQPVPDPTPFPAPAPNPAAAGHLNPPPTAPPLANPEPPSDTPGETPFRFFSPSSFWNMPLGENAALDPDSPAFVEAFEATIEQELQNEIGPWINTTDYSVPIYTVPGDQPTVPVQLFSQFYSPSLQSAWREVPLPPDARPSAGSDEHLVVWQPSSDRIWEFWRLTQVDGSWRAAWGGAMRNVSSSSGVYDADAWPGAESWWGSSASSLPIAGGLITLEDLQQGEIDHGLAMAIPNVRAGFYTAPAQRTDGTSSSPLALPEGAHLRLDPDLDLAAMRLPPLTRMIAEAAQRYGIVVRDRAKVAHFFAQDPSPTRANPYVGKGGYFEGKSPAQLLSRFPWSHLQLLPMALRRWGP